MKQREPNSKTPAQQVKKLEEQKIKTSDPALKTAIDKKIELLKTGKDIKKQ